MSTPTTLMTRVRRTTAFAAAALVCSTALAVLPGGNAPAIAAESRAITFPVDGIVRYSDDFGAPRSGGRTHEGNDLMGSKMQGLLATTSGRVSYLKWDTSGLSGNMLTITDAQGWKYHYMHINNDTPGTDDGRNLREHAFPSSITSGARVVPGQLVGYLGDSGNAESTAPHLHFEIERPDGSPLNPYESLKAAVRSPAATGRGIALHPDGGYYVVTGDGRVHAYDGAPHFGQPVFGYDIARGIAATPDGLGYVVLDGRGGLHKYGSASKGDIGGFVPPYFPFDIARSVAISPTGKGLYVLDGWGGVHTSGDAVESLDHPYWMGWDIARSVVAAPGTAEGYAVLDGWGGIFLVGNGLPEPTAGVWQPGNQWRGLALQSGRYLTVSAEGSSRRW